MAFYYLLLGHLFGDFVLQTDKIAENKRIHWKWNLLHVLVVTLCMLIFSYPFGNLLVALVLLNSVIHFAMDYYKDDLCRILHLSGLPGFLFDQSIHIILLYIISMTAVYTKYPILDFAVVKLLTSIVIITSFSAVFTQFVLASLFPKADRKFFEKGEKYHGNLTRIFIASVFYLSSIESPYYLLLLVITVIAFLLQFKLDWSKWMTPKHLLVKMLLDTVMSAVCIIPFISNSVMVLAVGP
jgi:hypothetical protein